MIRNIAEKSLLQEKISAADQAVNMPSGQYLTMDSEQWFQAFLLIYSGTTALNNGLLPIVVPDKFLKDLLDLVQKKPETRVRIDLEKQLFTILPDGRIHQV